MHPASAFQAGGKAAAQHDRAHVNDVVHVVGSSLVFWAVWMRALELARTPFPRKEGVKGYIAVVCSPPWRIIE